jgi:hypothetical protein
MLHFRSEINLSSRFQIRKQFLIFSDYQVGQTICGCLRGCPESRHPATEEYRKTQDLFVSCVNKVKSLFEEEEEDEEEV